MSFYAKRVVPRRAGRARSISVGLSCGTRVSLGGAAIHKPPRYRTVSVVVLLAPAHVTVTGQSPREVVEPIFHVQFTDPSAPAGLGPSPAALLGPNLYRTSIAHCAYGRALAASVAVAQRFRGEVSDTISRLAVETPVGDRGPSALQRVQRQVSSNDAEGLPSAGGMR